MPDDPAFIRAIAASPDDDAPRLIYADYLDETGDEVKRARAEFIRVQVERARLVPDTPWSNQLWHRDTALLDWAQKWRQELPMDAGASYGGFIRGFIDRVDVYNSADFLKDAQAVFDHVPIYKLTIRDLTAVQMPRLLSIAGLTDVRDLQLTVSWPTTEALDALTARGPWPNLRRLRAGFARSDVARHVTARFTATFRRQLEA